VVATLADPRTQSIGSRAKLPRDVRRWVDRACATVARKAADVRPYPLASQLELQPTAVIGRERLDVSLWFRLQIEPAWVVDGYEKAERINQAVAGETTAQARRQALGSTLDLPVAAAVDYDTAFAAGAVFGRSGIRAAAIPFGAFLADDRYASSVRVSGRSRPLDARKPARAFRSVLVARAFMEGWRTTHAPLPERLHLLGLGQPLVLAVTLLALDGVAAVSCDATSPFKDAAAAALYTEKPVFRRLDGDAVVKRVLLAGGRPWDCPCPFCRSVAKEQHWGNARTIVRKSSPAELKKALHLNRDSVLSPLLPYFSLASAGRFADLRAMHNHWVVVRCVRRLGAAARSARALQAYVRRTVKLYEVGAKGTNYAGVYPTAFEMARGTWSGF